MDLITLDKIKKPSRNRQVADTIAEKYNGSVIGAILGNKGHLTTQSKTKQGRAGYIVEIGNRIIHVYLINTWHRKRDAISINTEQLQQAVDDHALILMSYHGKEFVAHAENWELWAKQDNAYDIHTKFGTTEVFCKKGMFHILDLEQFTLDRYYPKQF